MIKNAVSVYAEITPNPQTIKYVADMFLLPEGQSMEFLSPDQASGSPLIDRLFRFPFVEAIYVNKNFISVTKNDLVSWDDVMQEIREFIQDFLRKNDYLFDPIHTPEAQKIKEVQTQISIEAHQIPQNETEQRIIEILEEYVRPAVEQDGGSILFKSFANGILTVVLKGSCNGCPSSNITLKSGVQSLFDRMMPEVKEVVALN